MVIDDHAVIRRGLCRYVELIPDVEVVAEAESGPEALAARVDPAAFQLSRPLDLMQGAITPAVRRAYTRLPGGGLAMAPTTPPRPPGSWARRSAWPTGSTSRSARATAAPSFNHKK